MRYINVLLTYLLTYYNETYKSMHTHAHTYTHINFKSKYKNCHLYTEFIEMVKMDFVIPITSHFLQLIPIPSHSLSQVSHGSLTGLFPSHSQI